MGKLNDLPDDILEHILSYVDDVKSLVRTSLISRRWRTLWKHAPLPSVLKLSASVLRSCTIERYSGSIRDVIASLISRPRRSALEINLEYFREEGEHCYTFVHVLDHCARFGQPPPEGLSISHPGAGLDDVYNFREPSWLLTRRRAYRAIKESLRTLKLERTRTFIDDHGLDFSLLTRLELVECRIFVYRGRHAFERLPSLKHLKLIDCLSEYWLPLEVTSVPQLLSLEVRMLEPQLIFSKERKEGRPLGRLQLSRVSAPRLQTLRFCGRVRDLSSVLLGGLSFPCLEHAAVRLILVHPVDQLGVLSSAFRDVLLPSLRHANSVHLCFEVEKKQDLKEWKQLHFPLIALKLLIESQGSPFIRLKTLRIQRQQPTSHMLNCPSRDPVITTLN